MDNNSLLLRIPPFLPSLYASWTAHQLHPLYRQLRRAVSPITQRLRLILHSIIALRANAANSTSTLHLQNTTAPSPLTPTFALSEHPLRRRPPSASASLETDGSTDSTHHHGELQAEQTAPRAARHDIRTRSSQERAHQDRFRRPKSRTYTTRPTQHPGHRFDLQTDPWRMCWDILERELLRASDRQYESVTLRCHHSASQVVATLRLRSCLHHQTCKHRMQLPRSF